VKGLWSVRGFIVRNAVQKAILDRIDQVFLQEPFPPENQPRKVAAAYRRIGSDKPA